MPQAMLEARLGHRPGRQGILRQRLVGPGDQGCAGQHQPALGGALRAAVAPSAGAATRWDLATTRSGHPTRVSGLTCAGEPVLALRVRHVDGPDLSGRPFERYADDALVHCGSEHDAHRVRAAIENRMVEIGLLLHPEKTKIVYCKDANRRGHHEHSAFTFLGYTFRARAARDRAGNVFTSFLPAVSKEALVRMSRW